MAANGADDAAMQGPELGTAERVRYLLVACAAQHMEDTKLKDFLRDHKGGPVRAERIFFGAKQSSPHGDAVKTLQKELRVPSMVRNSLWPSSL